MKKFLYALFVCLLACSLAFGAAACGDKRGNDGNEPVKPGTEDNSPRGPFDFDGNYTAPELTMDGLGNDPQWQAITEPLATFGVDGNAATVKAYRGESALFFFFEVKDSILATYGVANDDTVCNGDSIELYLDTKADGGNYPQSDDFQINLGIHGKARIMQGAGIQWGGWNGLIDYEVHLDGTLNDGYTADDVGYSVEVMVPYSQIGIEKDDTIGVAFGQVDKTSGPGNAAGTFTWNGWTFGGSARNVQVPAQYVLLDKNGVLHDRANISREITGYVVDDATGLPVAGVSAVIDDRSAQTDELGYFSLGSFTCDDSYTVTFSKAGYYTTTAVWSRAELMGSTSGSVSKTVRIKNEEQTEKTTVTGMVKNAVRGAVSGATVTVEGTVLTAETDGDGNFSIANVPTGEDIALVVTANGYAESKTVIDGDRLIPDYSSDLGEVNLSLPRARISVFDGEGAGHTVQVARAINGVEFIFSADFNLVGNLQVYFDSKVCGEHRDKDSTCWRFDLYPSGQIAGEHFTVNGGLDTAGLEWTVYRNDSVGGYEGRFLVPYSYVSMNDPSEIFGFSLGYLSGAWYGWTYNADGGGYVAPEYPARFMRLSPLNEMYRWS